jgi:DNA-binding MarR family transcriptional regulator
MRARTEDLSGIAPDSYEAAAALREALRLFARRSEDVARRHGLTARGYMLLLMVKTSRELPGRATPGELERRLQLAKSTVTELVQRCEDQGLVRREQHPHKRPAIVVGLTRKGERQLGRAFRELGGEREHLLGLLEELPRPSAAKRS